MKKAIVSKYKVSGKLTPSQMEVLSFLENKPGSYLKRSIRYSGRPVFVGLDLYHNPLRFFSIRVVEELIESNFIFCSSS